MILCNGKQFEIEENLFRAIIRLWDGLTDGPFWIDAICINQEDLAERSAQVQIMGDIYAKAIGVAVWLGEHDEASRVALPIIEMVGTAIDEIEIDDPKIGIMRSRPPFDDPSIYSIFSIEPITQSEWVCIYKFFSRTWFERVWIVGEIVLAQEAGFICGDVEIDHSKVFSFVNFLTLTGWDAYLWVPKPSIEEEEESPNTGVQRLLTMHMGDMDSSGNFKSLVTQNVLENLFAPQTPRQKVCGQLGVLCIANRSRCATDARDFIYAPLAFVLRLAGDERDSLPKPDYKMSAREVFIDTASYFLSTAGHLGPLSFVYYNNRNSPLQLPSWVPAFNMKVVNLPLISPGVYNATQPWGESSRKYGS